MSESQSMMSSINNEPLSGSRISKLSKVNLSKENKWELLPQIQQKLDELIEQNNNNSTIINLKSKFDKIEELKNKLIEQGNNLKLAKIITLRERNLYLEKLRQIEEYGDELQWKDSEGILKELNTLLYTDNRNLNIYLIKIFHISSKSSFNFISLINFCPIIIN